MSANFGCSLYAQSLSGRVMEIEKAQGDRLPKNVISLAKKLQIEATKAKAFDYLLYATLIETQAETRLDPEERDKEVSRLEALKEIKWLKSTDRSLLAFTLHNKRADYFDVDAFALLKDVFVDINALDRTKLTDVPALVVKSCSGEKKDKEQSFQLSPTLLGLMLESFLDNYERRSFYHYYPYQPTKESPESALDSVLALYAEVATKAKRQEDKQLARWIDLTLRAEHGLITQESKYESLFALAREAVGTPIATQAYIRLVNADRGRWPSVRRQLYELGTLLEKAAPEGVCRNGIRNKMLDLMQPLSMISFPELLRPGDTLKLLVGNAFGIERIDVSVDLITEPSTLTIGSSMLKGKKQHLGKFSFPILEAEDLGDIKDLTLDILPCSELGLYEVSVTTIPRSYTDWMQESFKEKQLVEKTEIGVSRLFPLVDGEKEGGISVRILDYETGRPVPGAKLAILDRVGDKKSSSIKNIAIADGAGLATIAFPTRSSYRERLTVFHKGEQGVGDAAYPDWEPYRYHSYYRGEAEGGWDSKKEAQSMNLYTDRPVYRPGAEVQLTGLAYTIGYYRTAAKPLAKQAITVILHDANYKAIDTIRVQTDDLGDFVAKFKLPDRSLGGQFSMHAVLNKGEKNEHTESVYFYVEEYKRPTFEIKLKENKEHIELGRKVGLEGETKLFSGQPLTDAKLSYQVSVSRYEPIWWWRASSSERPEIIAVGEVTVSSDGTFVVPVSLDLPEQMAMKHKGSEDRYSYLFAVEVVASSSNGETHSSTEYLMVGKDNLRLELDGTSLGKMIINKDRLEESPIKFNLISSLSANPYYSLNKVVEGKLTYRLSPLAGGNAIYEEKDIPIGTAQPLPERAKESFASGAYLLEARAVTDAGHEATSIDTIYLFSPRDRQIPQAAPLFVYAVESEYEKGKPAEIVYGALRDGATLFYDLIGPDGYLERQTVTVKSGQLYRINPRLPAGELPPSMKLSIYMVEDDVLYQKEFTLLLREESREIRFVWKTFRDRLEAGQTETWELRLTDAAGHPLQGGALAAWMYDGSLDAIRSYRFDHGVWQLGMVYGAGAPLELMTNRSYLHGRYSYTLQAGQRVCRYQFVPYVQASSYYNLYGYRLPSPAPRAATKELAMMDADQSLDLAEEERMTVAQEANAVKGESSVEEPTRSLRTNFAETAFFYPSLRTDVNGEVVLNFTLPESLTSWQLQLVAHTSQLHFGAKQERIEAKKDLMLVPNLPRYLREGDKAILAATIYNNSGQAIEGVARLEVFDPATDTMLSVESKPFAVESSGTIAVDFPLTSVEGYQMLGVRLMADCATHSDGEQHLLPILPAQEQVRRTLPFTMDAGETRTFELDSLLPTPRPMDYSITIEHEGGLLWPVLKALPALLNVQENDAIALSASLYSNLLADRLLLIPELRRALEEYVAAHGGEVDTTSSLRRGGEAYDILAEEMPWLAEIESEEAVASAVLGLLGEKGRDDYARVIMGKLSALQQSDGSLAWQPGMRGSYAATFYFVELFSRYRQQMGLLPDGMDRIYSNAWRYLDAEALGEVNRLKQAPKALDGLPNSLLRYLYMLAMAERWQVKSGDAILNYCLPILYRSMPKLSLYSLPYAAIVAHTDGHRKEAEKALETLRQHLTTKPDVGSFFAFDPSRNYYWYDSRYPLHTSSMSAFTLLAPQDTEIISEMQRWLLSQRRVQLWAPTPVTTDMIYALLLEPKTGRLDTASIKRLLGSNTPRVEHIASTSVGDDPIRYTVTNTSEGIEWGSFTIDYTEGLAAATKEPKLSDLPLELERKVYKVVVEGNREDLKPLSDGETLNVGDELRIVISIKLDRAMDFVLLTDRRAAATEPLGALTGFRYSVGTGYYFEAKDAENRFFFDALSRGTYELSYSQRVTRAGLYYTGQTTLSSAYAPSFSDRQRGIRMEVMPK